MSGGDPYTYSSTNNYYSNNYYSPAKPETVVRTNPSNEVRRDYQSNYNSEVKRSGYEYHKQPVEVRRVYNQPEYNNIRREEQVVRRVEGGGEVRRYY